LYLESGWRFAWLIQSIASSQTGQHGITSKRRSSVGTIIDPAVQVSIGQKRSAGDRLTADSETLGTLHLPYDTDEGSSASGTPDGRCNTTKMGDFPLPPQTDYQPGNEQDTQGDTSETSARSNHGGPAIASCTSPREEAQKSEHRRDSDVLGMHRPLVRVQTDATSTSNPRADEVWANRPPKPSQGSPVNTQTANAPDQSGRRGEFGRGYGGQSRNEEEEHPSCCTRCTVV
jgi:hypothetical protein